MELTVATHSITYGRISFKMVSFLVYHFDEGHSALLYDVKIFLFDAFILRCTSFEFFYGTSKLNAITTRFDCLFLIG